LLALVGIGEKLEQLLGCPVDVAEPDSLHALIRSEFLRQAVGLCEQAPASPLKALAIALSASLSTQSAGQRHVLPRV
jgi:hypothetical protein